MTNEILHVNRKLNFFSLRDDGKVKNQKETIFPAPRCVPQALFLLGFIK